MTGFLSTLATIWRLAIPYFRSEDAWPGRALLAAVLTIELAVVGVTVLINQWNARFYNALQDRNWDSFVSELVFFCIIVTPYIVEPASSPQALRVPTDGFKPATDLDRILHGRQTAPTNKQGVNAGFILK